MDQKKIVLIDKPIGMTPLQAVRLFQTKSPNYLESKLSYAGRLDPMADGLLVLLVNDENNKRNEYEKLDKKYEFTVLFGIETDTYDTLGIIKNVKPGILDQKKIATIEKFVSRFIGWQELSYPPYSSFHINGVPLFKIAREGLIEGLKLPRKKIKIDSFEIIQTDIAASSKIVSSVLENVAKVNGDFRQAEIIDKWKQFLSQYDNSSFTGIQFRIHTSSGTYIRSLAQKMGEILKTGATAIQIKRTMIGKYSLSEAHQLTTLSK